MIEIWVESFWFDTTIQRFAEQARITVKKGWSLDRWVLEIYLQANREEYQVDPHNLERKH